MKLLPGGKLLELIFEEIGKCFGGEKSPPFEGMPESAKVIVCGVGRPTVFVLESNPCAHVGVRHKLSGGKIEAGKHLNLRPIFLAEESSGVFTPSHSFGRVREPHLWSFLAEMVMVGEDRSYRYDPTHAAVLACVSLHAAVS